jgi:hypothetical protein
MLPRLAALGPWSVREVRLADALHVVAHEAGFASWPRCNAALATATASPATVSAAAPLSPTAASPRTVRQHAQAELAQRVVELAVRRDSVELACEFSRMPLCDILAVRALVAGSDGYTMLVDAFLAGLDSADPRIRFDCAHALDHFADARCVAPLRQLLDDPVPRVRRMALHVLSCEACKLVPLATDDNLGALVIERALADDSITVRRHAVTALGMLCMGDDARIVATLEALLARESDVTLRRNAQRALHCRGRGR